MKSLLAAISIISIAFGYIIAKSSSSSSEETQSVSSVETRHDRSKSRETRNRNDGDNALLDSILGGRSISEIPAADLAAICIKLSKYDPNKDEFSRAEQYYQFQLLLAKLSATEIVNIATELCSDPKTKNSHCYTMIVSALAGKDPSRAMDWISTHDGDHVDYQVVLADIAKNDPLTASSLLHSAKIDGKMGKYGGYEFIVGKIADSTAKLGADPFFSYFDAQPKELQMGLIYGTISKIPENDRVKFLDQLYQRIQDGRANKLNMYHLFSQAISEHKAAATEWLNKLPENEEKNSYRINAAGSLYGSGDKEAAFKWMKEAIAAAPGREKEIINKGIQSLLYESPEGIPAFVNLLPKGEKLTAKDIDYSPYHGYGGIHTLANAFSDPNEKSIFIADSLKALIQIGQATNSESLKVNPNELDILSRQIAAMGFTGQNADRVNEAIEALKGQASAPKR